MGLPEDFFGGVAQDDIIHTPLPVCPYFQGCVGVSPACLKIYRRLVISIIMQKILEVSSAALELQNSAHRLCLFCMQTLQYSGADPTVLWC